MKINLSYIIVVTVYCSIFDKQSKKIMNIEVKFGDRVYTAKTEEWRRILEWQRNLERNYKLPKELIDFYSWYYMKKKDE